MRNIASAIITEFGGAVAVPSAVRSSESTTTMRVNDVIMTRIDGAIDSTVSSAISWIARSVTPLDQAVADAGANRLAVEIAGLDAVPMIAEAPIAMLACARLGAVHSVVFGGFAAKELATRIDDAKPKLIFSASCGIEPGRIVQYKPLLDEAIRLAATKPDTCIILQRPQQACELTAGRDHDWATLRLAAFDAGKTAPCVPVAATDPLYILYTSGTTGIPKGVVRDNGGHLVALKWSMENLYGVKPGEIWWCGSDIGWVVGHSYIVYGPLIHGATTIMYEGKQIGRAHV